MWRGPGRLGRGAGGRGSQASVRRLGTTAHDGCCEDTNSALLQRFQRSEEELRAVAAEWLQCQKRIDAYVDEQVGVGEGRSGARPWARLASRLWPLQGLWELLQPSGAIDRHFPSRACRHTARGTHSTPSPPTAASEREHRPGPGGRVQRGAVGHRPPCPSLSGSMSQPVARVACLPHLGGGGGEALGTELSRGLEVRAEGSRDGAQGTPLKLWGHAPLVLAEDVCWASSSSDHKCRPASAVVLGLSAAA